MDESGLLSGGGVRDSDERRTGLAPSIHARLPRSGKTSSGDGYGWDAGFLDCHHVVGKPRRAASSMGSRPNHGVDFHRYKGSFFFIYVSTAAQGRAAGPEIPAVPLELNSGESLADVLGHSVYGDVRAAGHIVVEADGLAF
tara:strand:+ start:87 stop:509 length:423 start_codon:yes stop_codon:yes gene_type:complete